jgi:large subunit ribosomal protein L25
MADIALSAQTRSERGRHLHAVRRRGLVPAVLYGYNLEPQAISADARLLAKVWRRAGRTHLIELNVDEGGPRQVLIRDLQFDPRTARPLHADFFAVNLREKLAVDIPVVLVGESPAVTEARVGQLQQTTTTLRVECLPGNIPGQISVDVSGLVELDQGIHIRDIELPEGVSLGAHIDADELIVKVAQLRVAAEEEVEAAAEAEPAEVEAGDEGASPKEE